MTLTERVKALESQKLDIDAITRDMKYLNDCTRRYIESLHKCDDGHQWEMIVSSDWSFGLVKVTLKCSRCGASKSKYVGSFKYIALKRLRKHLESLK